MRFPLECVFVTIPEIQQRSDGDHGDVRLSFEPDANSLPIGLRGTLSSIRTYDEIPLLWTATTATVQVIVFYGFKYELVEE